MQINQEPKKETPKNLKLLMLLSLLFLFQTKKNIFIIIEYAIIKQAVKAISDNEKFEKLTIHLLEKYLVATEIPSKSL